MDGVMVNVLTGNTIGSAGFLWTNSDHAGRRGFARLVTRLTHDAAAWVFLLSSHVFRNNERLPVIAGEEFIRLGVINKALFIPVERQFRSQSAGELSQVHP